MNINKIGKVRLPIIYIAVSLLFSSIYYKYFDNDIWLAITIVSLFFLWVILKDGAEFFIFTIIIFIIGITININFYNLKINNIEKIRIEKLYSYGGIGNIKGREVFIKGDISNLKEGVVIKCKGIFERKLDKKRGRIGNYEIKKWTIDNNDINTKLSNIREKFKEKLENNIGIRKASLITSITFGKDKALDFEDQEYMKRFGIIHALSVSGLHIGVIFLIMKKLFKEKFALLITFFYVIMTGMAFSSVRAFIMLFIINLGVILKRRYNHICSLALSSIIIFLISPYCIFEVGFLLSFGATIGIILYNKTLNKKFYKLPKVIRETLSISLSAQLFTLPILIIFFNEISIGFIIGNLILIPIINLILTISIISVLFININFLFNYISFILKNIIIIFDNISELFLEITPNLMYINEYYGYFYISLLITFFIYNRGYKKIIILPLSYIVFITISLYSINPKIEYKYKDTLLVSYKGKRILLSNDNIDVNKMKSVYASNNYYKNPKRIVIKENCFLEAFNKDYILNVNETKYYLNMSFNNKSNIKYDIINFKEDDVTSIVILGEKILVR